jgi:L,D-peptidoglycan transpeptidase YkuD (ErfK/YbiS/YcfS/YnhG family)
MRPRTPQALVIAALAVAGMTGALSAVPAVAGGTTLPERLRHVGDSRQVVVATAKGWSTSHARLQAWQQRPDGTWHRVLDPVPARIGWNGFALEANRRQGSGETPAGTFRLLRGFGTERPPGVDLRYRVIDRNDWWPYDPRDPKTYNVFQFRRTERSRWRPSWAEDLDSFQRQYRYAVVLDYNLPSVVRSVNGQRVTAEPADTSKGGGIFLHVRDDGPTAGCVAVRRADMRQLLRWLDPDDRPIIVMGPRDVIQGM